MHAVDPPATPQTQELAGAELSGRRGTEAEDQAVSVGKVTEPALGGIFGLAPGGAAASDAGVVSFVVRYFNAYTGRLSSHYPVAHRARSIP